MKTRTSKRVVLSLATVATALFVAMAPAQAVGEDRAKRAFSAAEAKIESAMQAGAGEHASEVLEQARAALERARVRGKDDDEDRLLNAANEAAAYADLAIATAQLRALETPVASR